MDATRFQRLKQLFVEARELPRPERAAFVAQLADTQPTLARELDGLLAADATHHGDLLDRSLTADDRRDRDEPPLPERIGPYRIHAVCGHGGMGTVYEAWQDNPHRRVALKVLRLTSMRPGLLARFRREAEILGRLDHPAIATIHEAGEWNLHGESVPFLAMEFVEGRDLLGHADHGGLDAAARVALVRQVCEAVQHAHQQGVVHRDLKPENVLVTRDGRPKVLDFGVAKLTDGDVAATLATSAGELLGSVGSMSPEQAAGDPAAIDARSDVYALGVLLFRLLTGSPPLPLAGRPLAEALTLIREREPPRLGSLAPELRGELETVVATCLRKDPAERYASAAELADDLGRWLAGRPVVARAPGTWRQLVAFSRRHKALVGGVLATLVALGLGLVVSLDFAWRAAENARLARQVARRAQLAAANALLEDEPAAARRLLDELPADQRGWAWSHLDNRLTRGAVDLGPWAEDAPLVPLDDGTSLLSATPDDRLVLWDLERGRERRSWDGPGPVTTWGFSPDGRWVAAALEDGQVLVAVRPDDDGPLRWDERLRVDSQPVALRISADGTGLVVLEQDLLQLGRADGWVRRELPEATIPPQVALLEDGSLALITLQAGAPLLWHLDGRDLTPLARHHLHESPRALEALPGSTRVLIGAYFRDVVPVDLVSGERGPRLLGHTRPIQHVAQADDGRRLSLDIGGTLRLWSPEGTSLAVLNDTGAVRARFAGPHRVVSAGDGRLRLWDLTSDPVTVLRGHESYVYDLAFSPDGSLLASHSPFDQGRLIVWDLAEQRALASLDQLPGRRRLVFADDGAVWFSAGSAALRADWATGALEGHGLPVALALVHHRRHGRLGTLAADQAWTLPGSPEPMVSRLTWTPDGTSLTVDGEPLPLEPGEHGGPTTLGPHPRLFVGLYGEIASGSAGELVDVAVLDGTPDPATGAALDAALREGPRALARAVDAAEGLHLLAHFHAAAEHLQLVPAVEPGQAPPVLGWTSVDGRHRLDARGAPAASLTWLAAGDGLPGRLAHHSVVAAKRWLEGPLPAARDRERLTLLVRGRFSDAGYVKSSVAVALGPAPALLPVTRRAGPAPRRLAVCTSLDAAGRLRAETDVAYPAPVLVRDQLTGEVVHEWEGAHWGVALDPPGRRLAAGTRDGRLEVLDLTNGTVLERAAHAGALYALAWSPDGLLLATGGNDNTIRLWDTRDWSQLLELRGHDQYVKALAFSPDGTQLASASGDGTVRLWDSLSDGQRRARSQARQAALARQRPRVEELLARPDGDPGAVAATLRETLSDEPSELLAALVELARLAPPP